jgi:ParB family chromosome partitioning protein
MTTTHLQGLAAVSVLDLRPSPNNPRKTMTGIGDLATSIAEQGLIQPIVVQRVPGEDGYQIVAGHRRHAAVRKLGWPKVACIIRRDLLPDEELATMLVENGQRANLDPIEEARALAKLKSESGMTDKELGRKIGRSDAYVWGRLTLLKLPAAEQEELRAGQIGVTAAVNMARPKGVGSKNKEVARAWHFAHTHDLATLARGRCRQLDHKPGRRLAGGIACGECWEFVIRADERRRHADEVTP